MIIFLLYFILVFSNWRRFAVNYSNQIFWDLQIFFFWFCFFIVNIWIDSEFFFILKIGIFLKWAWFLTWVALLGLYSCLPIIDSYYLMSFIGCLRHIGRLVPICVLISLLAILVSKSLGTHFNFQLFYVFLISISFLLFWILILISLSLLNNLFLSCLFILNLHVFFCAYVILKHNLLVFNQYILIFKMFILFLIIL